MVAIKVSFAKRYTSAARNRVNHRQMKEKIWQRVQIEIFVRGQFQVFCTSLILDFFWLMLKVCMRQFLQVGDSFIYLLLQAKVGFILVFKGNTLTVC